VQLNSRGEILNDSLFRSASSADYILRAAKVVTLVDLAGHERYFKTTAYGLTGHMPDSLSVQTTVTPPPPPPPRPLFPLFQTMCSLSVQTTVTPPPPPLRPAPFLLFSRLCLPQCKHR
jgi:hypothetical protein